MDGLVYPDRTPHMGLLEYKNVHRPARVISYDLNTGILVLKNEMNYVDLRDYLYITYELNVDGDVIFSGRILAEDLPSIPARKEEEICMPVKAPEKGRVYLKVYYHLKEADAFREQGYLLGQDEIKLDNEDTRNQKSLSWQEETEKKSRELPGIQVSETSKQLIVEGSTFVYVYNKLYGTFDQLSVNGKDYLDRPMELNVWRAPTDNDMYIKTEWYKAMYDKAVSRAYVTNYTLTEKALEIHSTMSLSAVSVQKMMNMETVWTITNSGQISVNMDVIRDMDFPELPRFGLRVFLPRQMNRVSYYGMGPEESYIDKCRASSHGIYSATVEALHEDYLKPQENGSHYDCDYVVVSGEERELRAYSDCAFSFNASIYTQEELTMKSHNYELEPCGSTVLNLDYRQNGIGSNSCGPRPQKKYRLDEETFTFTLKLMLLDKQES